MVSLSLPLTGAVYGLANSIAGVAEGVWRSDYCFAPVDAPRKPDAIPNAGACACAFGVYTVAKAVEGVAKANAIWYLSEKSMKKLYDNCEVKDKDQYQIAIQKFY